MYCMWYRWLYTWKSIIYLTLGEVKKICRRSNFCFVCNLLLYLCLSCRMWQVEERWFPELPVLLSGSHVFRPHSVHRQPAGWGGRWKWKEGIHVHLDKHSHCEYIQIQNVCRTQALNRQHGHNSITLPSSGLEVKIHVRSEILHNTFYIDSSFFFTYFYY